MFVYLTKLGEVYANGTDPARLPRLHRLTRTPILNVNALSDSSSEMTHASHLGHQCHSSSEHSLAAFAHLLWRLPGACFAVTRRPVCSMITPALKRLTTGVHGYCKLSEHLAGDDSSIPHLFRSGPVLCL